MWYQYGGSCGGEKLWRTDCSVDLYSLNSDSLHCPVTVYNRLYLRHQLLLSTAGACVILYMHLVAGFSLQHAERVCCMHAMSTSQTGFKHLSQKTGSLTCCRSSNLPAIETKSNCRQQMLLLLWGLLHSVLNEVHVVAWFSIYQLGLLHQHLPNFTMLSCHTRLCQGGSIGVYTQTTDTHCSCCLRQQTHMLELGWWVQLWLIAGPS